MAKEYKKIFGYNLPWYKKYWNRIDNVRRLYFVTGIFIFISSSGLIVDGIRNKRIEDLRNVWITTKVRDINNTDFSSLDEEEPPSPLPQRTGIDEFREEFARLANK